MLIMKGNYYYNMHRKFQVHSTNIFFLDKVQKQILQGGIDPSPSITKFDSLSYPYLGVGWYFFR